MHATFFAYESADAARRGDPYASERFLDLDGTWKFSWVRNAEERPTDFFRPGFNDGAWGEMPVPGLWELNGYGDPQYLNIGYPWREQFENNPPEVPTTENHVGSYRREIEIPASWSDKQVIARFGSVTSNIYLWVNGRFVGYSEDSKLETEFDITKYVRPGKNLIAFQVFRWCDGTYLEDQDFFRLSGVGRDCYLYARDKRHIADVRLDATLSENYTRGRLSVELALPAATRGCTAEVTLTAPDGRAVASQTAKLFGTIARLVLDAGRVQPWSAEIPALYGVTVTLKDPAGKTIEIIPLHTGFREVKIEGGQLLVNGQPVLIKGANRHEMDPDGGYVVSEERMIEDIRILKENNFNAVRTCHYPDDARWYALCDRYGLYLVAEANLESHGMGYDEKTLAKNPAYAQAHLERNIRNVRRNINHPSVIVWSLGNEAGDGPNFDACYDWIKAYDPSRPVHYERAVYNNGGRNTDIVCPMYWDYGQCEKYLRNNPRKPLIQCEYAHAMGNSLGGFGEYWALIRQYPHYQGGFIWDFVDQSLRKTGKNGAMIYGYGGDWNPYDASDWNFCDNGLISPDRVPNPHMHEARYWQQPVWTTLGEDRRTLTVFNENFFRPLDNCYLRWTVLRDGDPVRSGIVADLRVAPQQTAAVVLPLAPETLPADGELLLNVEYRLCDVEPLLAPDHRVAYQQFTLRAAAPEPLAVAERMADRHNSIGTLTVRDDDRNYLIVESPPHASTSAAPTVSSPATKRTACACSTQGPLWSRTSGARDGQRLRGEAQREEPRMGRSGADAGVARPHAVGRRGRRHGPLRPPTCDRTAGDRIPHRQRRGDPDPSDAARRRGQGRTRPAALRHADAHARRLRPHRLLRPRAVGELRRPQGRRSRGPLPADRGRAVLPLHPSAGDRNQERRAPLAAARHRRPRRGDHGLGALLGLGPALCTRGAGRRADQAAGTFAGDRTRRRRMALHRQGAVRSGVRRLLGTASAPEIPHAIWKL